MTDTWVPYARIGRAKGLKGHLFVDPYNPVSDVLFDVTDIGVRGAQEQEVQVMKLLGVVRQGHRFVVQLEGVNGRDGAEQLTGKELFIYRKDLPLLEEGEFYHSDLLGFQVESADGSLLGQLKNIMSTASNDIFVVDQDGEEVYYPNIQGVILHILPEEGRIVVDPPEVSDAL